MKPNRILHGAVVGLALSASAHAQSPSFLSLDLGRLLTWDSGTNGGVDVIEVTTNLTVGNWRPLYYDFATNAPHSARLPVLPGQQSFYRVGVRGLSPDTNLILHLPFDNDFTNRGAALDISGWGNHGLRYGRPCCPTNWPTPITGPDGSQAAEFHWYNDGYGLYGKSGDYIVIPKSEHLTNIPQATICAWINYYPAADGNYQSEHAATLLNAGHATRGAWSLGRSYTPYTIFRVYTNSTEEIRVISFPDSSVPDGSSKGWHHYAVTFDQGNAYGYYNGVLVQSNSVALETLTLAGSYLGIACWTFNKTPELDLSVDAHPNNAWINGAADDIRIYRRVLSAEEIAALYHSFDHQAPTTPTNVHARAASSSQVELRWDDSIDQFGVRGYQISRDGSVVTNVTGSFLIDVELAPGTTHQYVVQAYDYAGNVAALSSLAAVTTLAGGGGIEVIVDDADGEPFVVVTGSWGFDTTPTGYLEDGYRHDGNSGKGTKRVTFQPLLPEAGDYSVYIRYAQDSTHARNVPVDVVHAGQTNTVAVDQRINGGTWFLLGTYSFEAGTNDFVSVRNDGTNRRVIADAIRWVK